MNEPTHLDDLPERPALALADPRDVILTTAEVHARYRLARTAGYELTRGPLAAYAISAGRWRLADLHAFENARVAERRAQVSRAAAHLAPSAVPGPRRGGRRAAA